MNEILMGQLKGAILDLADNKEDLVCAKIYAQRASLLAVERATLLTYGPGELDAGGAGENYVYNFQHRAVMFGVRLAPDDQVRDGANGKVFPYGMNLRDASPYRFSDAQAAVKDLASAFVLQREIDGAEIFDFAHVYDPSVGGDGQPLCSRAHPFDGGTWSNRFGIHMDLTPGCLESALKEIGGKFVDSRGLKILARGVRLIVPEALEDEAHAALDALPPSYTSMNRTPIVYPQLTNPRSWFVQTSIPGFTWFERSPLQFEASFDHTNDNVVIKGYERRSFCCYDPRAIFGAIWE